MRSVLLVLVLAELWFLSARTLPIRHFEANIVPLAIAQDRDGVLWLATSGGVWLFDGLHFEKVESPPGIDLSDAASVAAGPDGSIWISALQGLVRYRDGRFTTEIPRRIGSFIVTRAGRILAAPLDRTELYICTNPDRTPLEWSHKEHFYTTGEFHEDLDGRVWFGCGEFVRDWSDADLKAAAGPAIPPQVRRYGPATRSLDFADVVSIPGHHVWGRVGPEVLRIGNSGVVSRTTLPVETYDGVRPSFFLDRRGRLWMPGRQLSYVDSGSPLPIVLSADLENVTAVFEDRRGTLWLGLAGKGLAALPDESSLESFFQDEGMPGSVLDLAVHPALGLVAATDSGAFVLDEPRRQWQALPAPGKVALRSLAVDPSGALLYLPHSNGILRSDAPFRAASALPEPGLDPTVTRKIYRDPKGDIWIGATVGLLHMDRAGHAHHVSLPGHGTHASDFWMDSVGGLWVGYEGGVARCLGETCTAVILPRDGLLSSKIRSIAPGLGEVWVAYRESRGYSRFQQRAGGWSVTHFTPEHGYGPVDTHFVRRDRRGWIWRGSTDGVYVSDGKHTDPEDWIHLTFGDRVNASYANMYGFLEAADGSVWIGTQAGIVHLHPEADWFGGAAVRIRRAAGEFHLSRPGVPPFQSRLFRYRLSPVDSRWRFSSDGTLRYPKLQDGSYRLQVALGQGRPAREFPFLVGHNAPPPRARLWLWLVLGLASAGVTLLLAWRIRSVRRSRAVAGYWEEKRKFLDARAPLEGGHEPCEDWSGRVLEGRFLLQERIASGGFAAVYRALDQSAGGELVAVKLLHPLVDHADWRRRRFADEVTALQKLDDPGVVRIRHFGEAAPDRPYLVMEFVGGVTLRAVLGDGPLEPERVSRLVEQIGDAVAAAHRAGILHRDLKPENVMVMDPGSPAERIKLIDFGIADTRVDQPRTHTTQLAGSSGYVAPERWVGLETYASDIYSLAAIALEMLTGSSALERTLPRWLPQTAAELLSTALAYDPQQRPPDAARFAADLGRSLADNHPQPADPLRLG